MIAYKLFSVNNGIFQPVVMKGTLSLTYSKTKKNVRTEDIGPFACWKKAEDAITEKHNDFSYAGSVLHKVKIKTSKEKQMWYRNPDPIYPSRVIADWDYPAGTVLADEFEILEEIEQPKYPNGPDFKRI